MTTSKTKWHWDDEAWSEYDPLERAPWLLDGDMVTPVLSGEIRCRSKADALLIAAAPDLLSACEFIDSLDHHNDSTTEWNSAFKMVRAAVAKAKGESK